MVCYKGYCGWPPRYPIGDSLYIASAAFLSHWLPIVFVCHKSVVAHCYILYFIDHMVTRECKNTQQWGKEVWYNYLKVGILSSYVLKTCAQTLKFNLLNG